MQIVGTLSIDDMEVPSLSETGRHYRELYSLYIFKKGFETMEG